MSEIRLGTSADPIHQACADDTAWSRVNAAEAFQGVLTPLNYTVLAMPVEVGSREAMQDMGLFSAREVDFPDEVDKRLAGIFYGRWATNKHLTATIGERTPGTSATAFQQDLFGEAGGVPVPDPLPHAARYATIVGKLPVAIARTPRRLARLRKETDAWWRKTVTSDATVLSIEAAITLLDEARARLQANMRAHILGSMLAQATYERLTAVCAAAGLSGHENSLTTGYGGMEESKALTDLWLVAQGQLRVEEFIDRHGYHGPSEGEISSIVWREDLRPVTSLIERFKTLDPTSAPDIRAKRQGLEARAAEKRLLAELNIVQRPAARALLRLTGRYMLLREVGKAAYLQTIDGARFATRAIGARLEEADAIDERDDVFQLTYDELRTWRDVDARSLIAARKPRWHAYHDLEVPENWVGQLHLDPPVGSPVADSDDESRSIEGTGVSPGTVEGRAVVVLDPFDSGDVVEPGDIVVCPWTDPSWAPTMMVSAGLVIETGGPLSHGAIIARELGVPCVVAVNDATKRLRTGDTVRIDGATGTIETLHRDATP